MTSSIELQVRNVLADAVAFIRSAEANKAIAAVTFPQLIQEQILRNGDTATSQANQFNPYAYDPTQPSPGTKSNLAPANFAGGSDVNQATKIDRLLALQASLKQTITQLKQTPIDTVNAVPVSDQGSVLSSDTLVPDDFQNG